MEREVLLKGPELFDQEPFTSASPKSAESPPFLTYSISL